MEIPTKFRTFKEFFQRDVNSLGHRHQLTKILSRSVLKHQLIEIDSCHFYYFKIFGHTFVKYPHGCPSNFITKLTFRKNKILRKIVFEGEI